MATLDEIKGKYAPVFALMEKGGVRLDHLNMQDDKLYMQGAACSDDLKNKVWNEIKGVDPTYSDLICDLSVDTSLPAPPPDAPATYTVEPGDSLWKISEKMLGSGAKFKKIIEANPDKLEDENTVIHPGDVLTIPASA
jgi:nucleoid-associated protein YgaU